MFSRSIPNPFFKVSKFIYKYNFEKSSFTKHTIKLNVYSQNNAKFCNKNEEEALPVTILKDMLPIVAIIGRPNVGKSTFFNRLAVPRSGTRKNAIITNIPGTTRDRIYGIAETKNNMKVMLVDTGGIIDPKSRNKELAKINDIKNIEYKKDKLYRKQLEDEKMIDKLVKNQALVALEESHALIFLTDASQGITQGDISLSRWLKYLYHGRVKDKIILAVNKVESDDRDEVAKTFIRLGLGEPIPISAIHNDGCLHVLERAIEKIQYSLKTKEIFPISYFKDNEVKKENEVDGTESTSSLPSFEDLRLKVFPFYHPKNKEVSSKKDTNEIKDEELTLDDLEPELALQFKYSNENDNLNKNNEEINEEDDEEEGEINHHTFYEEDRGEEVNGELEGEKSDQLISMGNVEHEKDEDGEEKITLSYFDDRNKLSEALKKDKKGKMSLMRDIKIALENLESSLIIKDGEKYIPEGNDIRIALLGRPNVGKSSLLNVITGKNRAIVSPIAGTTHDPVDEIICWRSKYDITLVDTAGIRRKSHHYSGIESLSTMWALRTVERCDVALLVLDASAGIDGQDKRIAGHILERNRSVIVVVNKWDGKVKKNNTMKDYEKYVRRELQFLKYVPVIFLSAINGENVEPLIDLALMVYHQRKERIATRKLMKLLQFSNHKAPTKGRKKFKVKLITQAKVQAPTFVIFAKNVQLAHFSYTRFLENLIRSHYPYTGTPLRLIVLPTPERNMKEGSTVVVQGADKTKKEPTKETNAESDATVPEEKKKVKKYSITHFAVQRSSGKKSYYPQMKSTKR